MELTKQLVEMRKRKGMTQAELAENLGVTRQAVSRWETGQAIPTVDNLRYLSYLYGVPIDTLIDGDEFQMLEASSDQPEPFEPDVRTSQSPHTERPLMKWVVLAVFFLIWAMIATGAVLFLKSQSKQVMPEYVAIEDLPQRQWSGSDVDSFSIDW